MPLCTVPIGCDRVVGLVVKASGSREKDPGFESGLRRDFPGSNPTSGLHSDTPVAACVMKAEIDRQQQKKKERGRERVEYV